MPQEVFTLSGWDLGAHVGAESDLPAPASPPAVLQNALKALGTTAGDPQLSAVRVDGVVGTKTVSAVNLALAHYVGGTKAFPKANLTLAQVRQNAAGLAAIIADRVRKSGGVVPPVAMQRAAPRQTASMLPPAFGPPPSDGSPDHRWIWWVVGGAGVLVILTVAVGAAKKKK